MTDTMDDIEALAVRFGLTLEQLRELLTETDDRRGMLDQSDLNRGLAVVVEVYLRCLASAAERFEDPAERLVADRMVAMTVETVVAQLSAAPHIPN